MRKAIAKLKAQLEELKDQLEIEVQNENLIRKFLDEMDRQNCEGMETEGSSVTHGATGNKVFG